MDTRKMMIPALAFFLFFILMPTFGQDKPIKGKILNQEDSTAIQNVHIINKTTNKGFTSHTDGRFTISADIADLLLFTSIGFKDTLIVVTSREELFVMMTPEVYTIGEVTIMRYPSYAQFKQAVINLKVEEPMKFDQSYFPKVMEPNANQGFGLTIDGPITALYNAFSREGKQRRNYERYLRESTIQEQISRKYNVQIVRNLTGIEDDMEIIRFMQYCKLDTTFILQSTDYAVLLAVKSCYEAYTFENLQDK